MSTFATGLRKNRAAVAAFTVIEFWCYRHIAILAARLLPILSKGKEKGKGINCISNLKQCALGGGEDVCR